jgi:hypothetical protein
MDDGYENPASSCAQCGVLAYAAILTVNVSEVNAWLIVWLFLNIVYIFLTRVVVGGKIDGYATRYW